MSTVTFLFVVLCWGILSADAQTSFRPVNISDFNVFLVDQHNSYRSIVEPPAANMQQLSWDEELFNIAQTHANACEFEHDLSFSTSQFGSVGENIYVGVGMTPEQTVMAAVERWYEDEVNGYDFATNTCNISTCGHYTQLVWATTIKVGCAMTLCQNVRLLNQRGLVLSCYYGPAGNTYLDTGSELIALSPYIEGIPCSDCGSDEVCVGGKLCAPSSVPTETPEVTTAASLGTTASVTTQPESSTVVGSSSQATTTTNVAHSTDSVVPSPDNTTSQTISSTTSSTALPTVSSTTSSTALPTVSSTTSSTALPTVSSTTSSTALPTVPSTTLATASSTTLATASSTTLATASSTTLATASSTTLATASSTTLATASSTTLATASSSTSATASSTTLATASSTTSPTTSSTTSPTASSTTSPTGSSTTSPTTSSTTSPTTSSTTSPTASSTTSPTASSTTSPTSPPTTECPMLGDDQFIEDYKRWRNAMARWEKAMAKYEDGLC